jgi:hypothetical protein
MRGESPSYKMQASTHSHAARLKINTPEWENDHKVILSADLESTSLNFHFYIAWENADSSVPINLTADPWIRLLIIHMMSIGGDFRINGKVSRSLLENITRLIDFHTSISPTIFHPVNIIPDELIDDSLVDFSSRDAILTFSGGLDASFTAYRHTQGLAGINNFNIKAALMIHGADIFLDQPDFFDKAFDNSRRMLLDLGISDFYRISTNFKQCLIPRLHEQWAMYTHMGCIIAIGNIFSNTYPNILVGSALPYKDQRLDKSLTANSTPISLYSSNFFRVYGDDFSVERCGKAKIVSNWEEGKKRLRVCWKNMFTFKDNIPMNCGVCEKCVRTSLNFLSCGVQLPTMPPLTKETLFNLRDEIKKDHEREFRNILEAAYENHCENQWWVPLLHNILDGEDEHTRSNELIINSLTPPHHHPPTKIPLKRRLFSIESIERKGKNYVRFRILGFKIRFRARKID